ncbi:hypothetical protein E2562_039234, partial [Oryza meyeriana var. granulata]
MCGLVFDIGYEETKSDDEYSATPKHDSGQSDSDPNFEETDESEDESYNEAVFDSLKKNFLEGTSKLKDRTSFSNNKEQSPEPFELDGPEDIVVDITNSHDAAIPTETTNNSSMNFILVDYEDPMEEIKSLVQNETSDPPTGDATEPNLNENYPTMDNINTAEPMVSKPPTDSCLMEEHQGFDFNTTEAHDDEDLKCAKLATLVDYLESPEEIGDPNLDLALNNITMPCTEKATE